MNYLSREEALGEFRNWSGFGGALDMLEEPAAGRGGGDPEARLPGNGFA